MSENIEAAAMILGEIRNDTGPFYKLAGSFSVNKSGYFGAVVVSPLAVYLLKSSRQQNSAGGIGGIAGAMIASAFSKDDGLATCKAEDLPMPVRTMVDPKQKLGAKDVMIVPKTTVSLVKKGFGKVTITSGTDKFVVTPGMFSGGKARASLGSTGWPIDTEMTPTAAPVHDMRSAEEKAHPKQKPLWVRVLAVIGAILLILLVIAARASRH